MARPDLLPGHQQPGPGGAPAAPVRGRDRLGGAVRRRLAAGPAPPAAPEAAPGHGRPQRAPLLLGGRRPALRLPHGRRPAWLHLGDVRRRGGHRGHPRSLQRAPARRGLRRRPLGAAPRQHLGGQHRPGDRQGHPVRAAPQHDQLHLPRGLGDGRAVPRRLRLPRLRAQQPRDLGPGQRRPLQGSWQPGRRGDHRGRGGHHRSEHQLLRDGQPPGLPQPGAGRRRARSSTSATGSRSAVSAAPSPVTSSPAYGASTASRRSGSPAHGRAPTTTRGWPGRSAS